MAATPLTTAAGIRISIGLVVDVNLFQLVMPYSIEEGSTVPAQADMLSDVEQFVEHQFYDLWKEIAAEDQHLTGWQVENYDGPNGPYIPYRATLQTGSFPGLISGDSTPPQTSVLFAYNAVDQAATTDPLVTAHTYLGPGPESKWDSGVINDAGYDGDLGTLLTLTRHWTGSASTAVWKRIVTRWHGTPARAYAADYGALRQNLFTQRRRMRPLF